MPNLIINKRNIGKSAFQLPEQAYVNLIFENIIIPRQVSEQSNRSLEDEQFEDQIISTQFINLVNTTTQLRFYQANQLLHIHSRAILIIKQIKY